MRFTTMKLVVCLTLLGFALSSKSHTANSWWQPIPHISENSYRINREFRYLYDGQVSTGLPLPESQHSATRIQAVVVLQPVDERSMLLQLAQIRFGSIQHEFEPRHLLPFEQFDHVQLAPEHEQFLTLPLRFMYKNGMISDIEFSHEEEPWSANIKRAILNMLQVNLLKKGQNEKVDNEVRDNQNDYFVATERVLEGECEVAYTKTQLTNEQMQWTKSINYEKCSNRPEVVFVRYGWRFTEQCEECANILSDERISNSMMTFNISGTPDTFLIHEVELKSQQNFAPVNVKQQLMASFVNSKLKLVYAGEIEKKVKEVRGDVKESLMYNLDWELAEEKFAMTGDEKYLRRIPQWWNNKADHIEKLISSMVKHIESHIELETTHIVARLVKILRVASEEDINRIHRFLYETNKYDAKTIEKLRAIYIDALAMAGTKITITHLIEKISKKQVSPLKAAHLMKTLVEVPTPSNEIIEEISRLCESDVAARNPIIKQSCWLTYGAVLNGLCGESTEKMASYYESKKVCPRQVKEKFVRKLMEQYERSETRYEKILVIKTLANAAIDTSIFELEKIIVNKKTEKTVRVQAFDALRKLRSTMPRKIQNILMPVYKDSNELPEIRMAALYQIMQTLPEKVVIDQIIYTMLKEKSQQVLTFTYTTLKNTAESTNPCEKTVASWVAKSLHAIPVPQRKMFDSRYMNWDMFSNEFESGAALNWAALFSNDSILPKEIMASIDSLIGGQWNKNLAQVGIFQHNIDTVLHKLLQKVEESGLEQLVVRGKRSTVFRPADMLRSLFEKLHITPRQSSQDDPHALLYVRYKDMDYAILPMDLESMPDQFKNIVRDGKIEVGDIERIIAKGSQFYVNGATFFYESTRKMPTALGLPIIMSTKMPTVWSLHGHIKMEIMPMSSVHFNGMRLRLVAKPSVASTHVIKVEVLSPIVNSGIKLLHYSKLHMPVDVDMEINWEKKFTVKTTFKAPESKKHIAQIQSRPVTFVRVWKKMTRAYPEPVEQSLFLKESEYPEYTFDREYFEQFGLKMVVSGRIRQPFFSFSSITPIPALIGDNFMDITIEPMTNETPREYQFLMEMDVFEPIQHMEKPELSDFFEKETNDLFQIEDGEYKDEDENKRRMEFNTYIKNFNIEKAYKHSMSFKVQTVGDSRNYNAQADISAVCDDKIRYCRLHVDVSRSTLSEVSPQWKMKVSAQTLYPAMPTTLVQLYDQVHREFHGVINAHWGYDKTNNINIKVQGEQSSQQKKWMKRIERKQYKLTEEQKLIEASKLNQYKMIADYNLSPETKYQMDRLFSMLKVWKMWNTNYEMTENKEGRIEAQLTIEPETRRTVSLTIKTPTEQLVLKDIHMPFQLPTANIHSSVGDISNVKTVMNKIIKQQRAECVVKSKEIKTFDNLYFKAPMTPCYSVLAKDCSSEKPRFAVLMKKVNKNAEEKKLKVISHHNVIEIELFNDELVIKINGEQTENQDQLDKFGVTKMNNQLWNIDIDDVTVFFDGYQAKIKLSPLYKSKQCGICGHYDGEDNDFRKADNMETSKIEEFHNSFMSDDDDCEKDEPQPINKNNYKVISEETSSSEEQDEMDVKEPILRTRVLERGQHVCFSVEPVAECPSDTQKTNETNKDVVFKCIRRSHPESRRLMRLARKQVISRSVIEELKADHYSKSMQLPKMCAVY
uniref:Vitellogenin domain-containing protein n=1 Tax=Heterorhabditis bacteriophora TaxID=37862 RepID=A0A1I7XU41_HETBA